MFKPDFIEEHLRARDEHDAQLLRWMRAHLEYDPQTGDFLHLASGKTASRGAFGKRRSIVLNGQALSMASAVWFWHHGGFPPGQRFVRVNGDLTDDRIENLGIKTRDGTIEGAGKRWVARDPKAARRADIIGVYWSYERALAAYEGYMSARDLV